ncbi:MAG: site-2 protease family protein [Candidatus Peribacteria bacterium]|jgi:regulator of sigma E protease|nr:site-2 protease family protein [Candidatus Peribacteria bacterium]
MISLALAFFNLLPIPALDGGRGIGVIIQAILKIKPENYFKYEGYVNAFFFYLLILLGIIIIFKDLIFFRGLHIPFIG